MIKSGWVGVRIAGICASLVLSSAWAFAQETGSTPAPRVEKPRARIPRVSRPPTLSDFINGHPREAEAQITGFVQRQPGDGKPVSRPTIAYLSYDNESLYVVFVCDEKPGAVRAGMVKREDLGDHDTVGVYLDTFHDGQRAYVFSTNALGIQKDAILTEGAGSDVRFDTYWKSEGRLTESGFIVWMAIPFKSLRFPTASVQTWGIALSRSFVRDSEAAVWPHITRRQAGFVRQMADLEGIERISSGKNLRFIPYFTAAQSRVLMPAGFNYASQTDKRAGLDTKAVLRDAFTLDVTVNPDFSQVESDDPQVTINQRFEVFFPEKRPFFIENAGFFQSPINLFFSRRIIDPEFGARLTGKIGRWTIGALAADDRAPGQRVASGSGLFGKRAINGIVRVQREFGEQSRIGFTATDREFGSSLNRVVSADTRLQLSPNWFFRGQLAHSYNRQTGGRKLDGPASFAELSHQGSHFTYVASYSDRSPDFRAPLGFIPRVDIRQMQHYAGYFWWPENSVVLTVGPSISTSANWDRQGRLQDWFTNADWTIDFAGPTGIKMTRYEGFEFIDPYRLRYHKTGISFYTSWLRMLTLYGSYSAGTSVNYNPGYDLPLFTGRSADASLGFTARPTPRLRIEQYYFVDHLSTPANFQGLDELSERPVFTSHLLRTKVNYQFTRAFSLRGIADYYGVLPEARFFNQERFKQVTGDVLFTYMPHPGTALYFGYNSRHENLSVDPDAPTLLRRYGAPNLMTGRLFFVKLSYLFRF